MAEEIPAGFALVPIAGPDAGALTLVATTAKGALWFIPPPPPGPLTLTGHLPDGQLNVAFPEFQYSSGGGVPPRGFSIASGALPDGLTLDENGHVTGTPTAIGTFFWVVQVVDSTGTVVKLNDSNNIVVYMTSQPYPVLNPVEAITAAVNLESGELRNARHEYTIPAEPLAAQVHLQSGDLRDTLIKYTIPAEAIASSVALQSGSLRVTLHSYFIPVEAIAVSVAQQSGTLRETLITTTMLPESIATSVALRSGVLQ